jgi:pSer/pThr/pTyr-binding forkhead associated (FHA) protein
VPESLLTILKFCFLAVLYLFFFRVLRAVWAELGGGRLAAAAPVAQQTPRRAPSKRSSRGGKSGNKLRVVEPSDRRGQTYDLGDELTLGRATGCQVTIDDNYVSQLHARVFRREGQLYIEDLGSTNGTYLNRKKVTAPIAVRRGDRLQVGRTVLELN